MVAMREFVMQSVIWSLPVRMSIMLIVLAVFVAACQPSPLEKARKQVPIGMLRDDAIRILGEKAWYHQPCSNLVTIDDLFFYGSHKYDKAGVVIVSSEPMDGVFVVYKISSFESYAWHTSYQDCIRRDKFED